MGTASNLTPRRETKPVVRRFQARESALLVRQFHEVSDDAASIIASSPPLYGSLARALQVGTEYLIRQKGTIRLRYKSRKKKVVTYKLLPRTVKLISDLAPRYGDKGHVIDAVAAVLLLPERKK